MLHGQMLAYARRLPVHAPDDAAINAAFEALSEKIGIDASRRVVAALQEGASDEAGYQAARTLYQVAPTMSDPHGVVLLRLLLPAEQG